VKLEEKTTVLSKNLSGGMQRRLSIAIALVGAPDIIFLDEPSTGLDPKNTRQLWNVLTKEGFRENRALIVTTHSMEEADVLCNRIGIMTSGVLRCVGSTLHLKNKYGGGYHLFMNCKKDNENIEKFHEIQDNVKRYVGQILPNATLSEDNNGNFTFKVPLGFKVSELFDQVESQKDRLGISDWGISLCTLEDVFLSVVKKCDGGTMKTLPDLQEEKQI
jgi:ABC-type multidrug transport system ATPase subunit